MNLTGIVFSAGFAAVTVMSCASSAPPMSVKMVHPETRQTLTCAARDQSGRSDKSLLASAVAACVNNLKTRGFVVEN
jgi:hypothetical protein